VRRVGRVDDVGESGGTVDDLYMFDGIADGSREALVRKGGILRTWGTISGIPTADDSQHRSLGGPCSGAFLTSRSS
jgi:hypothetical protein